MHLISPSQDFSSSKRIKKYFFAQSVVAILHRLIGHDFFHPLDFFKARKVLRRHRSVGILVPQMEARRGKSRPLDQATVIDEAYRHIGVFVTLKSSKAPTNYFTPNILRKSWSRLVVSVVHLDALAFPVAAT